MSCFACLQPAGDFFFIIISVAWLRIPGKKAFTVRLSTPTPPGEHSHEKPVNSVGSPGEWSSQPGPENHSMPLKGPLQIILNHSSAHGHAASSALHLMASPLMFPELKIMCVVHCVMSMSTCAITKQYRHHNRQLAQHTVIRSDSFSTFLGAVFHPSDMLIRFGI